MCLVAVVLRGKETLLILRVGSGCATSTLLIIGPADKNNRGTGSHSPVAAVGWFKPNLWWGFHPVLDSLPVKLAKSFLPSLSQSNKTIACTRG